MRIHAPHNKDTYLAAIVSFLAQLCEASLAF